MFVVVSGCFLVEIGYLAGLGWFGVFWGGLGCFGVVWGVSTDPYNSSSS